jgi:hypothetical protein
LAQRAAARWARDQRWQIEGLDASDRDPSRQLGTRRIDAPPTFVKTKGVEWNIVICVHYPGYKGEATALRSIRGMLGMNGLNGIPVF